MRKPLFLIALICFLYIETSAQQVSNIHATLMNESTVRVAYDLEGEVSGQLFTVKLFNSANEFNWPLEYVDGYVGERVEAGINKFIDWDISRELVAYGGELTFEVRAELTFTPISVVFPEKEKIARGKQHVISWEGTNSNDHVDIQLYRDGKKVANITNTINDGNYQWEVPYSTKPGKGYTVKISSTSSSQTNTGEEFTINRKIPLLVKLIPLAVITPIVIYLTDEEPQGPTILPAPPNRPN